MTRKPNRTGRSDPGEHFTKMIRSTMSSPAWRALSTTAQALYPWIKLEWRGPDANNNGSITLPVSQAADRLTLRANKSETFDCLKFTLGGAGERFDGNARTSAHAHALAFLA